MAVCARTTGPESGLPTGMLFCGSKKEQAYGARLILWTCRADERLQEAVDACAQWGLIFDAVNDNLPERINLYGNNSRKVSADEYWDDKAVFMGGETTYGDANE